MSVKTIMNSLNLHVRMLEKVVKAESLLQPQNWGYLRDTSLKYKMWSKPFHNNAATEVNEIGGTKYIVQTLQNRKE